MYDVVLIAESWLNDDFTISEVKFFGYEVYRSDRKYHMTDMTRGGGVLIAIRNNLKSSLISIVTTSLEYDHVFVSISFPGQTLIYGCTYIPPSSPLEVYVDHCSVVEELVARYPDAKFFLSGDYNLNTAVWKYDPDCGMLVDCPPSSAAIHVCETFNCLSLVQVHSLPNQRGVFLDLLFCDNAEVTTSAAADPLFCNSHNHDSFSFSVPLCDNIECQPQSCQYFDYANCDLAAFRCFLLDTDWDSILSQPNIDIIVDSFTSLLVKGIEKFTPIKVFRPSLYPKWFSNELRKLTREKKLAHLQFKSSNLELDYQRFSQLRARCKFLSARCYEEYMADVSSRIKTNPKYFWKFSSDSRKVSGFPRNMLYQGASGSSTEENVDLFADLFSSVYQNLDVATPSYPSHDVIDLNGIMFSHQDVFKALSRLPLKFSSGPDGIPPFILKKLASLLCRPLASIFNRSLSTGEFPALWKSSFIFPIFKSGNRSDISNYRGVCIQSATPKLLDCLISQRLSFACKQFIIDQQHGFMAKRSINTNLLSYQHDILESFKSGFSVHSVYTDVAKAFDRVNCDFLVSKLKSFGVGDTFICWLRSYLRGRTQRVKIGDVVSKPILVSSGVGQGSHIGPILFSIFFNDLPEHIQHSSLLLFADDVKIYKTIKCYEDCVHLQEDITRFAEWLTLNGLQLSLHKCVVMSFSRTNKTLDYIYSIQSVPLRVVEEVKDLGVILDTKLSFTSHISNLSMKCFKLLGFIYRTSKGLNSEAFMLLYVALIRSLLEFGCIVWSPHYAVHKDSLERVQKKFFYYLCYRYRSNSYPLPSLVDRRVNAEINFFKKLLNGDVDCPKLLSLVSFDCHRRLRSNNTFYSKLCKTNYIFFSPLNRMMREMNSKSIDFS